MIINEGFSGRRPKDDRLPPGQYLVRDFPVLSLGPTPDVDLDTWKLQVGGLVDFPGTFTLNELKSLGEEKITKDIHCVTKWSKFDTTWSGVSLDKIMATVRARESVTHLISYSEDGYSGNLPIEDITSGKAHVALSYEGGPIEAVHGGPARLLVPHLYFWKSAKWLKRLEFTDRDIPGFWETRGYHNYGDPWKEERYNFL